MNTRPSFHRLLADGSHALAVALLFLVVALATQLATEVSAAAQCAVCDTCASSTDCGPGETCYDFGEGNGLGRCSVLCDAAVCPGDSRCFTVTAPDAGAETDICLNPDAPTVGICGGNYQCSDNRTCPSAGASCANDGAACGSDAELCVDDGAGNPLCACYCASAGDCGPSATCVQLANDTRGACVIGGSNTGLCADVMCPAGQLCDPGTGNCVSNPDDLCADVTCPPGAICSPATGTCIGGSSDTMDPGADTAPMGDTSPGTDTAPSGDTTGATDTASTDTRSGDASILLPGTDAPSSNGGDDDGCGCSVTRAPGSPHAGWLAVCLLVGLALVASRRRRPTR